jgi:phosphoglycerate dehydrogenase-like enzyme
MTDRPRTLILIRRSLYDELFSPESDAVLRSLVEITMEPGESEWTSAELAQRIGDCEIAITGWGSPQFTDDVLDMARQLHLIAHSAGSIKHLLPPAVFERGVAVTHAASAIAPAVAEMSLLLIMLLLRQPHTMDRALKTGEPWATARGEFMGHELAGQRVGVVGAGYTGRGLIRLLRAVGAEVWLYDPYIGDARATALGARNVSLATLLASCPIVSLQAPATAGTYHMLGPRELGLLPDGAILINTARSWLVDEEALLDELASGRIRAALDVFDEEPLPEDHAFRQLDNVFLTPHAAGATEQARRRQGQTVVDEIGRYLAGETLRYQVTREMLDRMA